MAARQVLNKGWRYHAHSGNFKSALRLEEFSTPFASSNNNLLIRMQAAPVSQLDLDQIRGVGKLNKPLPAIAGVTGAGVVAEVAKGSPFKEGDRVILTSPIGSWSTYQSAENTQVVKVPESVPVEYASLFSIGPLVAYNILKQAQLSKGEALIVNGSDSVLGLSILQIAKHLGINAVGLIQSSADSDIKIEKLKQLGLDVRADPLLDVKSLGEAPRLGINLVGGFSAAHLARLVRAEGTILTIGSSSNEPHLFHNSDLVDKSLTVKGGPIFSWLPNSHGLEKAVAEISSLIKENKLKLFVLRHELKNVQDAIDDAENLRKVILMHEGNEKTWSNIPRDEYMKLDEKVQNIWKAASAQQEPYLSSGKEQPWTTAKGHDPVQPSNKTAQKLEKITSVEELEKELSNLTPEQKEELGIPNVGSVTLTPEQLKKLVENSKNKK